MAAERVSTGVSSLAQIIAPTQVNRGGGAPTPANLAILGNGKLLDGLVEARLPGGNIQLNTQEGIVYLRPDPALQKFLALQSKVVIRIEHELGSTTAKILSVDGTSVRNLGQKQAAEQPSVIVERSAPNAKAEPPLPSYGRPKAAIPPPVKGPLPLRYDFAAVPDVRALLTINAVRVEGSPESDKALQQLLRFFSPGTGALTQASTQGAARPTPPGSFTQPGLFGLLPAKATPSIPPTAGGGLQQAVGQPTAQPPAQSIHQLRIAVTPQLSQQLTQLAQSPATTASATPTPAASPQAGTVTPVSPSATQSLTATQPNTSLPTSAAPSQPPTSSATSPTISTPPASSTTLPHPSSPAGTLQTPAQILQHQGPQPPLLSGTIISPPAGQAASNSPQPAVFIQTPVGTFQVPTSIPVTPGTQVTLGLYPAAPNAALPNPATPLSPAATPNPTPSAPLTTPNTAPTGTPAQPLANPTIPSAPSATPHLPATPVSSTPMATGAALPPLPPSPAQHWEGLEEAMRQLQLIAPQQLTQFAQTRLPQLNANMLVTSLFFLSALKGGKVEGWTGKEMLDILETNGRGQLVTRLQQDFGAMQQLFNETREQPWQTSILPLYQDEKVEQAKLFIKNQEQSQTRDGATTSRFIIELNMSYFGPMQLDGFFKQWPATAEQGKRQHLAMLIRTHQPLELTVQQELRAQFHDKTSALNLQGSLEFSIEPTFPTAMMETTVNRTLQQLTFPL